MRCRIHVRYIMSLLVAPLSLSLITADSVCQRGDRELQQAWNTHNDTVGAMGMKTTLQTNSTL